LLPFHPLVDFSRVSGFRPILFFYPCVYLPYRCQLFPLSLTIGFPLLPPHLSFVHESLSLLFSSNPCRLCRASSRVSYGLLVFLPFIVRFSSSMAVFLSPNKTFKMFLLFSPPRVFFAVQYFPSISPSFFLFHVYQVFLLFSFYLLCVLRDLLNLLLKGQFPVHRAGRYSFIFPYG